ncbi:MAG: response regulator [Gemmatimonadaceae bacterium]|nr:response regulator [Gemmatimonadaceae bacterium]
MVLVGDPDWDTRTILLRALEHAGFLARAVESGDALLDAAAGDAPDLVIAEIYLRCRSGRCTVQCMKRDPVLRVIPVLVYTSRVLASDEQWAHEIGAEGFLMKPAWIEVLVAMVRDLIATREASARRDRFPEAPPGSRGEDRPRA